MLDAPVDAWYVWVGLAVVATAALGTVTQVPTAPPSDAAAAAGTVERVAAADHPATARHPVDADAAWLAPGRLGLRDDGRTTRADLALAVTPVDRGTVLWRVLRGARPSSVFDGPAALRAAARQARDEETSWRRTDQLFVRRVTWEGVDVTLVGA
jgi:hypothetical protein